MAMPFNSTTSSNQTWSEWAQSQTDTIVEPLYEVRDQVVQGWEWLQEFLPGKVTNYVEKSAEDGQKLLGDIYEETRDSIVEKTSDNVDDITGLVEGFIQKLTDIKDNTVNIGEYQFKESFNLNFEKPLNGKLRNDHTPHQEVRR